MTTHNTPALEESVSLEKLAALSARATDGRLYVHDFADLAVTHEPMPSDVTLSCDHPATITVASMGNALTAGLDEARANAAFLAASWNHVRQQLALASRSERVEGASSSPWGNVRGPDDGPPPQIKEVTGDVLTDIALQADGDDSPAYKQAVGYQIVGSLADHFGVLHHPAVQQALDYLSDMEGSKDPLPWPSEPLPKPATQPEATASGHVEEIAKLVDDFGTWASAAAAGSSSKREMERKAYARMQGVLARNTLLTAIRSLVSQARERGIEEAIAECQAEADEHAQEPMFSRNPDSDEAGRAYIAACMMVRTRIRALKNTTPARSDAGKEGEAA